MNETDYASLSTQLASGLSAAYPEYVRQKLRNAGVDSEAVSGAVRAAAEQLSETLASWALASPSAQLASPLEIFREALAGPTAALEAQGVPIAERDDQQRQALPGDLYDLAPATSRDLGEDLFNLHIAWGIARAKVIAGVVPKPAAEPEAEPAPAQHQVSTAILVGTDLMDRSKILAAAEARGFSVLVWRNPAAIHDGLRQVVPAVAFIDLTHGAAHDAIRSLVAADIRTVAFGPHVDDHAIAAARTLGADDVMARSRFFRILPDLFPTQV